MGVAVMDPMEIIKTLKERESKLFEYRRTLADTEQHIEGVRLGYWRQGIEGKYSADREAALAEMLSTDDAYLGFLVRQSELTALIDTLTVEVNYYTRIHALQLAMIRVSPN